MVSFAPRGSVVGRLNDMARFKIQDLRSVEGAQQTPISLSSKVGEMISSSTNPVAKVETLNPETGEYRVVLQGTLATETKHS